KEIVGDEVVKAIVGSSGAEGDRDAIKEAFHDAQSPAQLNGVITHYEGLMGGQLSGLRRQYQRTTGLNDFSSFVSNLAQQKLTTADRGRSQPNSPVRIASDADYGKLASGTTFLAPDGTLRRKP
ncbi:MAG: hypothetical protein ACREFP_06505, partial [Acetobacteraceae bacterium]